MNTQTYRIEITIAKDGQLAIHGLPFPAGEKVEVIVRSQKSGRKHRHRYPLRGKPVRYIEPFQSVAEDEWEVLK